MKHRFLISAFVIVFVFIGQAHAQQAQEELVTIPKSQLTPQQLQTVEQANVKQKIETYGEWVGLGKEIGVAVDSSLGALTERADQFSKTGVGKFTMVIVAWKVLGNDLLQVLVGVPFFIAGFFVWIWSFKKNCLPQNVLVIKRPDGTQEYKRIESNEEQQIVHCFILLVFIVVVSLMIFA